MNAWIQLFRKELRLQRANVLLGLGTFLLGIIGLFLIAASGDKLAGFSARDIQSGLLLGAVYPVLLFILPVMAGSTAAAAERPMGVLAWQSALPVRRWQVIAVKAVVVAAVCVIFGGVLSYIVPLIAGAPQPILETFGMFWIGWVAILCGAIGFYGGSFARDDYQGLLMGILPTAVVAAALLLPDSSGLVIPGSAGRYLTHGWFIIFRILAVAVLLVIFAARMHLRTPALRWRWMAGSLAMAFVAGYALTVANVWVEGSVLRGPKITGVTEMTRGDLPSYITMAKVTNLASVIPSAIISDPHLMDFNDGSRMVGGTIRRFDYGGILHRQGKLSHPSTFFTLTKEGRLREFPSVDNDGLVHMLSANGRWVLAMSGNWPVISGPAGFSIPLWILPKAWAASITSLFDFRQRVGLNQTGGTYRGVGVSSANDVVFADNRSLIWKNGKTEIPSRSRVLVQKQFATGVHATVYDLDANTSVTALLRSMGPSNVYELKGFAPPHVNYESADGRWVSWGLKDQTHYSRVGSFEDAVAEASLKSHITSGSLHEHETQRTDDGSTISEGRIWYDSPVIESGGRSYTLHRYAEVSRVIPTSNTYTLEIADFGVKVVDMESGDETSVSLRLPGETLPAFPNVDMTYATEKDPSLYAVYRLPFNWNQESQTLATVSGNVIRIVKFENGNWTKPDMPMAVAPHRNPNDAGVFINGRSLLTHDGQNFWKIDW